MAQLPQRLGFDLTNTFAGYGKMLAHFFQRVFRAGGAEAESHLDHFLFARRQRCQNFISDFAQVRGDDRDPKDS